jgi:hypothetical protein
MATVCCALCLEAFRWERCASWLGAVDCLLVTFHCFKGLQKDILESLRRLALEITLHQPCLASAARNCTHSTLTNIQCAWFPASFLPLSLSHSQGPFLPGYQPIPDSPQVCTCLLSHLTGWCWRVAGAAAVGWAGSCCAAAGAPHPSAHTTCRANL